MQIIDERFGEQNNKDMINIVKTKSISKSQHSIISEVLKLEEEAQVNVFEDKFQHKEVTT